MKLLTLVLALAMSGCATYGAKVDDRTTSSLVQFIIPGRTTRDEIVARLGPPHISFERDRVISYVVANIGGHLDIVKGWPPNSGVYNLIVGLNAAGIVEKHGLVLRR